MPIHILIAVAGLMGAAGVALAAVAAHSAATFKLDSAAYLLLFHAPALIAGALGVERGLIWKPLGVTALAGFALGSTIFAGDLCLRAFAGTRLFPMAAPAGGTILILSWLAITVAAVIAMVRS
jgi:uncharacterized membrane protein YgdD (TMEM256/DUF423 family)